MAEQATATSGGARHSYVQALIPLDKIERREQVRKDWDSDEAKEALEGLTESVKQYGVLQPLLVAPVAGTDRYQVIAGSRRTTAMTEAAEPAAPCLIVNVQDEADVLLMQLQENVQRRDLSLDEKGQAFESLLHQRSWSMAEMARRLGLPEHSIRNTLKVYRDGTLGSAVRCGLIAESVAARLIGLHEDYSGPLYEKLRSGKKVMWPDVAEAQRRQKQDGKKKDGSAGRRGVRTETLTRATTALRLHNQGASDHDIAAELALTEHSVRELLSLARHYEGHQDYSLDAIRQRVGELSAQGFTPRMIGKKMGIGYGSVIHAREGSDLRDPSSGQSGLTYAVDARDSIVRDVQDVPAAPPHPAAPILDLTAPPTHVITSEPAKVENAARSPLPMRTHTSEPAGQPTPEPAIDPDAKWMHQMVGMVPASQFNWLDAIANRAAERGWSGYELRSRIRAARAATRA